MTARPAARAARWTWLVRTWLVRTRIVAGPVLGGCLALACSAALGGCALPAVPGTPAATVTGPTRAPTAAPGVTGLDQLGGMVDTARSLAAQANGHASEVEALASRLGVPVASLVAQLGGATASAASAGALLCALVTPVEVAAATGVPVGSGVVGGSGGAQCQWSGPVTATGQGRVAVRVTSGPLRAPHGAAKVPGVTGASYVAPVSHGWQAGARPGRHLVVVTMTGPRASRTAVEAVLALALARI